MPQWVQGADVWKQRARLRLEAVRGAFCYDRSFGSRLASLGEKAGDREWLAAAREALLPEPALDVTAAQCLGGTCVLTLRTPEGDVTLEIPVKEEENGQL